MSISVQCQIVCLHQCIVAAALLSYKEQLLYKLCSYSYGLFLHFDVLLEVATLTGSGCRTSDLSLLRKKEEKKKAIMLIRNSFEILRM